MKLGGLVVALLLLAIPATGWAQGARARTQVVQNNEDRGKAAPRARPLRKLPRRGVAKRQAMQVGPRFFDRLMRMPAADREKFLQENQRFQRLPVPQRQRIEQRLQRLSEMEPTQREQVMERYRLFDRLPREKQAEARTIYQRWQKLPVVRRRELLDEYDVLRDSGPDARRDRLDSKEFSETYSSEEQEILRDLSGLLPERPLR